MISYKHLDIDYFLNRLERHDFFSYTKINHGFWENLRDWFILSEQGITPDQFDMHRKRLYLTVSGFYQELLDLMKDPASYDQNLIFAMSQLAYADSREREGTPIEHDRVVEIMSKAVPEAVTIHDGTFWKMSMINGNLKRFFELVRSFKILAVGPAHLTAMSEAFQLTDFQLLEIPLRDARKHRHDIEADILKIRASEPGPMLILFQAATLAPWLIFRLHKTLCHNTWMMDLGRALDICSPRTIRQQNWFRIHCHTIYSTWKDTHPDWKNVPEPPKLDTGLNGTPRFIQDKTPDNVRIQQLLQLPSQKNRWTNFGPLSKQLEETIRSVLSLPSHKAVIPCNSATTGLFALAGLHQYIQGKPLRFVTSAYGFFSTSIGPLAEVKVLDCDEFGMLSLKALNALDPDSYDAVIVTNLFGAAGDLAGYSESCKKHKKLLLVDNAYGFDIQNRDHYEDEVISFHHTKPWGFGEGGCIITHKDREKTVRSLLNFGVGLAPSAKSYALNGKLSEVSAAYIIDRLQTMPYWGPQYRLQYRRIALAAAEIGLTPLLPQNVLGQRIDQLGRRGMLTKPFATPAHVPLLVDHPIDMQQLKTMPLPMMKYYKPLADVETAPQAHEIYSKIVNIPCHNQIRHFSTDALFDVLKQIKQTAKPE